MFESVLMRAFLTSEFDGEGDLVPPKSRSAEKRAFTKLASVCWYWRLTLNGWPSRQSLKHWPKKLIKCEYMLTLYSPLLLLLLLYFSLLYYFNA